MTSETTTDANDSPTFAGQTCVTLGWGAKSKFLKNYANIFNNNAYQVIMDVADGQDVRKKRLYVLSML